VKNVEDVYVLSSLQQRMLIHALAAPGEDVLYERLTCKLQGDLDVPAMQRAWQTVLDRHPALRTAFAWEGLRKPLQVVRKQVALPWRQLDHRHLAPGERERRWAEVLRGDRERGFDLTQAPLCRLILVQAADDLYDFVWSCHHLVTDGWCLPLILNEVLACYGAFRQNRTPVLDRPRPFRDYIAWLKEQDTRRAERFWGRCLAGYHGPIELPVERPADRAVLETERYQESRTELSAETAGRLAALAARNRISVSTIVEGAWALLLARYSGRKDLVYGATVSGRPPDLPGVERIVGPFINNVPVRLRVDRDEKLLPWLGRLHAAKVDLEPYEYCPLEQIQGWSELGEGRRLFQSLVVYENYPLDPRLRCGAAGLRFLDVRGSATASFPLTLIAVPGERLPFRLRYDGSRYQRRTAEQLLSHLVVLLEGLAADPSGRLEDLALEKTDGRFPFDRTRLFTSFPSGALEDPAVRAFLETGAGFGTEANAPVSWEMSVLDAWGQPAPVGVPGELLLRMPAPAKNDAAEVQCGGAGAPIGPGDGKGQSGRSVRTGDQVRLLADGRIEYLGRLHDPLAIGPYRVDPQTVETSLVKNPLVGDAAVVGRRDPLGQMQLAVYVVPAKGSKTLLEPTEHGLVLEHVRSLLASQLPPAIVPGALVALDQLPRTADGEVDTAALPEPTRPRPESAGPLVVPRDALEARLAALWSDLLGVHPIGATDRFMDLGGDSALAVSLVSRIEDQFQRRLPLVALFHEPTVQHLASLLRRPAEVSREGSLVPIRPGGAGRALFCIHPAGGTVFCYLDLARLLPEGRPVYGLQAQGIDGVLPPHASVEEMAGHYVQAICRQQKRGPYLICGWSSGGIIAFEVARQIEAQGEVVAMLALIDAGVADPGEDSFGESDLLPMLMLMFPGESEEEIQRLRKAGSDEQLAWFQERAELARLLVAGAGVGHAQNVYQVFQANMEAITRYHPKPFRGKITLFRAAEHATPMHKDPYLGWGRWAKNGVEVYEVPGNHVTMFRPPTIEALAGQFGACLARADPGR
jgi:thioesterase domain-containing protein/acyl carrier protein